MDPYSLPPARFPPCFFAGSDPPEPLITTHVQVNMVGAAEAFPCHLQLSPPPGADFTPPQQEHARGWAPPASAPRTAAAQRAPRLGLAHRHPMGHPTGHQSQHSAPRPSPLHPLGSPHSPHSPGSSSGQPDAFIHGESILSTQCFYKHHHPPPTPTASGSQDILACSLRAVQACRLCCQQQEQPPSIAMPRAAPQH